MSIGQKMHLCQPSVSARLRPHGRSLRRRTALSPNAGVANGNAVPAHRRHPGVHHRECRDGNSSRCAGVLLPDRWEDQALLWALLMTVCCDWSTLGVVLILLDDGLGLGHGVPYRGAVVVSVVDRRLSAHCRRTLMTGIGGVIIGWSGWSSRKVYGMRVLLLLRWRALRLIPGRAEWILSGRVRRRSILVVPLWMLRVRVGERVGVGSAHRWNDRGGCWGLRVVVLLSLLLTVIGHVYGGV